MKSIETELAELRERVARLETRLNALTGAVVPPVTKVTAATPAQPTSAAPAGAEPPVMAATTPSASPAVTPVAVGERRKELSSSVWIAGIGAVIFLIGAFYGLTVAIQRGWISPLVRVGAGMVAGAAIASWAARMIRERRGLGVAFLAVGAGLWTFSLFYGSRMAELFPAFYGLSGTVLAVIACGLIAARIGSDGALAVSLATGLVAPLIFASGRHEYPALLGYLIALSAAQFGVHFLAKTGEDWRFSRLLGSAGVWLVALFGAYEMRHGSPSLALTLIPLLVVTCLAVAWLPGLSGQPWAPGVASAVTLVAAAWVGSIAWGWTGLEDEGFAPVLVAFALASAGLVQVARWRTGGQEHDRGLIVLAIGFALVAAPVAWAWRWVTIAWGVGALGLAWIARGQGEEGGPRGEALVISAGLVSAAASGLWLVLAIDQGRGDPLFLNRVFVGGALAAGAWGVMVSTPTAWRGLAFIMLQAVAVNAVAWEFARAVPEMRGEEATLALGKVLATLTYALAGALQWLRGVNGADDPSARNFRLAGYTWLAVAGGKLFWHDLAGRDLVYKAVAALAVGAIFLIAALWANRRKAE